MSTEEVYKNRKISIKIMRNEPQLFIDGKLIQTWYHAEANAYFSNYLPYRNFPTLEGLAKAIIDGGRA